MKPPVDIPVTDAKIGAPRRTGRMYPGGERGASERSGALTFWLPSSRLKFGRVGHKKLPSARGAADGTKYQSF